jgi:hypothetical protein
MGEHDDELTTEQARAISEGISRYDAAFGKASAVFDRQMAGDGTAGDAFLMEAATAELIKAAEGLEEAINDPGQFEMVRRGQRLYVRISADDFDPTIHIHGRIRLIDLADVPDFP